MIWSSSCVRRRASVRVVLQPLCFGRIDEGTTCIYGMDEGHTERLITIGCAQRMYVLDSSDG